MNVLNRIYSVFLMIVYIFCIKYLINSLFFTLGINEDIPSITRILSSSISFSIFWIFFFKNLKTIQYFLSIMNKEISSYCKDYKYNRKIDISFFIF